MKREQEELEDLEIFHYNVKERFENLCYLRTELLTRLLEERLDADRNFCLMKSLIKTVKETISKKSNILDKDVLTLIEFTDIEESITQIRSNFENIISGNLDQLSEGANSSLERLSNTFLDKGEISKEDIKNEALSLGIDMAFSAISYIGDINSEVNKQREIVKENRALFQNNLKNMLKSYRDVYKELLRIREIATTLNKSNEVFVTSYQHFLNKHFINENLNKLSNKSIKNNQELYNEFLKELEYLLNICNNYASIRKVYVNKSN